MANATPVTGRASIPSEANSKGGINETTPPDQRVPTSRSPLTEGPDIGERGEYKPALYKQEIIVTEATETKPAVVRTLIREDR